jgi:hypothetical protein
MDFFTAQLFSHSNCDTNDFEAGTVASIDVIDSDNGGIGSSGYIIA